MKRLINASLFILLFSAFTFAQWNTQIVDNSGDVGKWSDIAYDNQGYPHIVYFDDTDNDIMYAKWNGTGWEIKQIYGSADDYGCAIAIDRQDYAHIVFKRGTNYIDYYNNTSGSWEQIDYTQSAGSYGGYPDICLYYNQSTGQTTPHITWYNYHNSDYKDLYHAYLDYNTNELVEEPVDQASDVGINSHITCDSEGKLYISYYDQGSGALKFAHYDGSQWSTSIIDNTGNVGRYNSIALDNNNKPCISYYDETNADLKYVVIENVVSKR